MKLGQRQRWITAYQFADHLIEPHNVRLKTKQAVAIDFRGLRHPTRGVACEALHHPRLG
jgi:hypothetical protein